jgi:hypothetical protein
MKWIIEALALFIIGAIALTIALLFIGRPLLQLAEGELRCEGAGAVIIRVQDKDYAVNGMASGKYPLVQSIWNEASGTEVDINRLIARGLTLCDWHTAATK